MTTDNFRKHASKNPLQRWCIERFSNALIQEMRPLQIRRLLDAGCGEGFMLERLREAGVGEELEGIDANPEALALARRLHPNLTFREGSIYTLPYPDASFDAILCSEVLEHLEEPERALAELARVTSGYGIITVPHEPFFQLANFLRGKNLFRWGNDIEHLQHWSRRGAARLVGTAFDVVSVRTSFPWTIIVGQKRS